MIPPRVTSAVLVSALRRKTEADGGFATVLAKGDPTSGAILLLLVDPDGERILERILQPDGLYAWGEVGNQAAGNDARGERFLERRRRFDPDLWILELNVASAERFVAALGDLD